MIKLGVFGLFFVISGVGLWAQGDDEWRSLFDGESLAGWQVVGGGAEVRVEDGAIRMRQARNTSEHTFARTEEQFEDFILEMECRRSGRFYYGILWRAVDAPADADVRLFGYQVKVDHNPNRAWTGGVFDDFGTSWNWMYTLENDSRAREALKPVGEWDRYRIEAMGDQIRIWINDVPTANISNGKYGSGYVALKTHFLRADTAREGDAAWIRGIRIVTENPERFAREIDIPLVEVE